jgi:hypothetical protein
MSLICHLYSIPRIFHIIVTSSVGLHSKALQCVLLSKFVDMPSLVMIFLQLSFAKSFYALSMLFQLEGIPRTEIACF